jgi:hypothetical protein
MLMKNRIATFCIAASAVFLWAGAAFDAKAQSELSTLSAISALPVASVVVGASAAAGAVVTAPVMLSTAGAVLVIKTVEVTARGTVYLLERASDGARVSVEVLASSVVGASWAAGTLVTVSVIGAGTVLSAAGEAIAFVPNALGRALLHNERIAQ